jgi:hypothetical protein
VVPGVGVQQARAAAAPANARRHWLAPGFPSLDKPLAASTASISSLLRELDADLPAGVALTVLVPAQLDGVDAQRPVLSRPVEWRVLPGAMPSAMAQDAARQTPFALSVRYATEREPALRYLRAVNVAWRLPNSPAADIAPASHALGDSSRYLAWLVPGPVPPAVREWIDRGGIALLDADATLESAPPMTALWRDDKGVAQVEGAAYGAGRVMRLTGPLSPQTLPALLDGDFPQRLRDLFEVPAPMPARVFAAEHAPATGGSVYSQPPRDLQPWLLMLIAVIFLLERFMASGARQRAAP